MSDEGKREVKVYEFRYSIDGNRIKAVRERVEREKEDSYIRDVLLPWGVIIGGIVLAKWWWELWA